MRFTSYSSVLGSPMHRGHLKLLLVALARRRLETIVRRLLSALAPSTLATSQRGPLAHRAAPARDDLAMRAMQAASANLPCPRARRRRRDVVRDLPAPANMPLVRWCCLGAREP